MTSHSTTLNTSTHTESRSRWWGFLINSTHWLRLCLVEDAHCKRSTRISTFKFRCVYNFCSVLKKKKVRSGGERSARSTRLANTVSLRLLKARRTPLQLPTEEREREEKNKHRTSPGVTSPKGQVCESGLAGFQSLSFSILFLFFSFFFPLFL